MAHDLPWKALALMLVSAGAWLALGSASPPSHAQAAPKLRYAGADSCKECHQSPKEEYKESFDFVRLDEYATWKNEDKHSQAFEALKGPRAQEMGKLLGYSVAGDARCLSCHAMDFPPEQRGRLFKLSDGVSCDGCHGPASAWLFDHRELDWRTKPAGEKAKLGMLNIRDPQVKARMCLSCHVGDADAGKVLTHEMYAAGHPPLPAFELETFCENLPRHWRPMRDKPPEIQKQFQFDPEAQARTKNVVIGGVLVLREQMRLLAKQTGLGQRDFAQFDCYACHHELQQDSWRQKRGYFSTPGRPPPPEWPMALMELGVHAVAKPADAGALLNELNEKLARLRQAYDARPFGDASAIEASAKDLAGFADKLLAKLDSQKIDKAGARRLLARLVDLQGHAPDYDSAWQQALALEQMLKEAQPSLPPELGKPLERLRADLHLKLPSGKDGNILKNLPVRLDFMGKYHPDLLRKPLADLQPLLPAK